MYVWREYTNVKEKEQPSYEIYQHLQKGDKEIAIILSWPVQIFIPIKRMISI